MESWKAWVKFKKEQSDENRHSFLENFTPSFGWMALHYFAVEFSKAEQAIIVDRIIESNNKVLAVWTLETAITEHQRQKIIEKIFGEEVGAKLFKINTPQQKVQQPERRRIN